MKLFISAAAIAIVLASPAFSQSAGKKERPKGEAHQWQSWQSAPQARPPHSPNPAWDVYRSNGRYAGSDPDPSIRSKLLLDNPTYGD